MTISARLVLPLEPAGGGGDFRHVAAGRVVDEQRPRLTSAAVWISRRLSSCVELAVAQAWLLTRAREQSKRRPVRVPTFRG